MSLVRIINGPEVTFRKTSSERYVVTPIVEEKVDTPVPDRDYFSLALEEIFTKDEPTMVDSVNDELTGLIDFLWAGGNLTGTDKCDEVISTNISFIDIIDDEWSKK